MSLAAPVGGPGQRRTSGPLLTLAALWVGFVGALIEILVVYFRKRKSPLILVSPDFVWMAPLVLLGIVAVILATGFLAARISKNQAPQLIGVYASCAITGLNLFMLIPGLAHWAAALLALGAAWQLTQAAIVRSQALSHLMRRSIYWLAPLYLLMAPAIWWSLSGSTSERTTAVPPTGAPNILLITLDTVRAQNLSLYGYARKTTPNLERIAQRGVVFDEAYSTAPWTLPSHASLMTGRWSHQLSTAYDRPLDDRYPTLAEYVASRGYETAGFVANLKYCGTATGLSRGFTRYEDHSVSIGAMAAASTVARTVADNFRLRRLLQDDQHLERVRAPELNARALHWLAARGQSPFFMFLNYFDAHEPYLPDSPFDRAFGSGRAVGRHSPLHHWLWNPAVAHQPLSDMAVQEELDAYDGALSYLDHYLGQFIDALDRQGILKNTVVVITADHGEEFGEHGVYEHGYSLYKASLHVPLVIIPAGGSTPNRIAMPVSLRDVAATIVTLAGLGGDAPFAGVSLSRFMGGTDGPSIASVSPVFSELSPPPGQPDWFPSSKGEMQSLVHDGVRYVRFGDGSEEMYDLATDVSERTNLVARQEYRQPLATARAMVDRWLRGAEN